MIPISDLEIIEEASAFWKCLGTIADSFGNLVETILSCDCDTCSNQCGCDNENRTGGVSPKSGCKKRS